MEIIRTILREETSEDGFGSLNYDPFTSDASLSEARKYTPAKKRILLGYSGRTFWRWSITACLGIVTGCVAVALSQLTNAIVAHRRARFGGDPTTMRSCVLFDCLLACLAAGATTLLAPGAAGSGIPVVKAYLNGVRVRGCLSPKCFLVKFSGRPWPSDSAYVEATSTRRRRLRVSFYAIDAILASRRATQVGAGASLGPEGPLVHLGAMAGSFLTGGVRLRQTMPSFLGRTSIEGTSCRWEAPAACRGLRRAGWRCFIRIGGSLELLGRQVVVARFSSVLSGRLRRVGAGPRHHRPDEAEPLRPHLLRGL